MPEKQIAVFDLDNTLLREPALFDRSLQGGRGYAPGPDNIYNGPIDWVQQEVLEETAAIHGKNSRQYVELAIAFYTSHNRGRTTHNDLVALAAASGTWPEAQDFYKFTPQFAIALKGLSRHLHCITYSPQFLAERLLVNDGIALPGSTLFFDTVAGSTYEVDEQGHLNGNAYTPGDKAASFQHQFGKNARPEYALGDTLADAPMLRLARFAIATNAEPDLRDFAIRAGITLVDESTDRITIKIAGQKTRDIGVDEIVNLSMNEVIQLVH